MTIRRLTVQKGVYQVCINLVMLRHVLRLINRKKIQYYTLGCVVNRKSKLECVENLYMGVGTPNIKVISREN